MNNTILSGIDQIEELTLEAEMSVIKALCDCYEKQAMILEYSTSEDVSEFSVFQEGFKDVLNEAKGSKGENIVLRILKFIPRLVMGLVRMIKSKWGGKSKIEQLEDDIADLKKMNEKYRDKIASLAADLSVKADKSYVRDKVRDAGDRLRERIDNNWQDIHNMKGAQTGLEMRLDDIDNREELRDRVNKKAQLDNANRINNLEYDLKDANRRLNSQDGKLNSLDDDRRRDNEAIRKRLQELTKEIDTYHGKVTLNCKLKEYTEAVEERAEFIVRLSKFDFKNDDVRVLGNVDKEGLFEMQGPGKSIVSMNYYTKNYIMSYDEFVDCVKRLNAALETISKTAKPITDAVNEAIDNLPEFETRRESMKATQPYREILFCISTAEEMIRTAIGSVNMMMNEINELRKIYGKFIK